MFERIKFAKKLARARKSADRVVLFLWPHLFPARAPDGRIDPDLKHDQFVVSYIYGAAGASIEVFGVTDVEERGCTIWQVFERLFPGSGKSVTETCNKQAQTRDSEFLRSAKLGYVEMLESFNSGGEKILKSLLDHCHMRARENRT